MKDRTEYDLYVRGTVVGVDEGFGPEILVEDEDGNCQWLRLPTPEGEDPADYWLAMKDRQVVIRDYRSVSVEVLDEP